MTNTFNFTDRASYKAYVAEWKATYKANSKLIRDLKAEIKHEQKNGSSLKASMLQSKREYMRKIQRNALIERAESKVEAQRQYEAAKDQRAAA
jgi:hypothetical protein